METVKRACVIDGRIVPKWEHKAPDEAAHIVAWCPHCLSYGGPLSIDDRVCGNCGEADCRMYQEVKPEAQDDRND